MTAAITIGSYRLFDFVELNICQTQKVWPGCPILISDDLSDRSEQIAEMATRRGCTYAGSNTRRGHFSGDMQAVCNAVQFARAHNCDLAIKISQRFMFRNPVGKELLLAHFKKNPDLVFGLPGKIGPETIRPFGTMGFTKLPVQTDLMVFRVKGIDLESLVDDYRKKIANRDQRPESTFVEGWANDLFHGRLKNVAAILTEFTSHINGREGGDLYVRRNQNNRYDFTDLAKEHGLTGDFQLEEWARMEPHYWPFPRA